MKNTLVIATALFVTVAGGILATAQAPAKKTVWDGAYTKEQADQIVTALEAAMRQVRARFSEDVPSRTTGFRFKR